MSNEEITRDKKKKRKKIILGIKNTNIDKDEIKKKYLSSENKKKNLVISSKSEIFQNDVIFDDDNKNNMSLIKEKINLLQEQKNNIVKPNIIQDHTSDQKSGLKSYPEKIPDKDNDIELKQNKLSDDIYQQKAKKSIKENLDSKFLFNANLSAIDDFEKNSQNEKDKIDYDKDKKRSLQNTKSSFKKREGFNKNNLLREFYSSNNDDLDVKSSRKNFSNKKSKVKTKKKIFNTVTISKPILLSEFAYQLSEKSSFIREEVAKLGIKLQVNDKIDLDTMELVATSLGYPVNRKVIHDNLDFIIEDSIKKSQEKKIRPPVVAIFGHVNHGKTTLINALTKKAYNIQESGNITQNIFCYEVKVKNPFTLLDTPGHNAFDVMRSLIHKYIDIAIVIIAADEGLNKDSVDIIEKLRRDNSKVNILVAINKIDKKGANVKQIIDALPQYNLIPEDIGGDTIVVPISAKNNENVNTLLDSILLLSDMSDLKASFDTPASGVLLECYSSKNGITANLLVQNGVLRIGSIIVTGKKWLKIKKMVDLSGNRIKEAVPSQVVQILGINEIISANEKFFVTKNEKEAKHILNNILIKDDVEPEPCNLDVMFSNKKVKVLSLIIKSDSDITLQVILNNLSLYVHPDVQLKVISSSVGSVLDSDITLASTVNAKILVFNSHISSDVKVKAARQKIELLFFVFVHELIDSVKDMLNDIVDPITEYKLIGKTKVLKVFSISKLSEVYGCVVLEGIVNKNSFVKVLRDKKVILESNIKTLKKNKDIAQQVRTNVECGIELVKKEENIISSGDIFEVFDLQDKKIKIF